MLPSQPIFFGWIFRLLSENDHHHYCADYDYYYCYYRNHHNHDNDSICVLFYLFDLLNFAIVLLPVVVVECLLLRIVIIDTYLAVCSVVVLLL